jgi:TolB protein
VNELKSGFGRAALAEPAGPRHDDAGGRVGGGVCGRAGPRDTRPVLRPVASAEMKTLKPSELRNWVLTSMLWAGLSAACGQPPAASQPAHDEGQWLRNVRQLTTREMGLDRAGEAYFSADGRQICFQAYPTGKEEYQIYVMNVDGSGLQRVSTGVGATTCSYFHPSGAKLIFASNHEDLRPATRPEEMEAMRPRGDSRPAMTQPAPGSQPAGGGHPGGHPGGEAGGGHPGGHPGGDAAGQGGSPGHGGGSGPSYAWKYFPGMEIYEYTLATGKLRALTKSEGYDAEGSYSPDGQQIVFSSFRDGDQEIYIMDVDGQNPRRITHAKGGDGGPFFSPDGRRIVYRSDRNGSGNLQIFVNNTAGTAEKAITGNDDFNWCPFWHPSGKWLIFTHADFRGRPNFDLYILRDDGSVRHRVTSSPDFDGLPVFSPDGKYLMWTSKRNGIDAPQIFIAEFLGLTPAGELTFKPTD